VEIDKILNFSWDTILTQQLDRKVPNQGVLLLLETIADVGIKLLFGHLGRSYLAGRMPLDGY